MWKRHRWLPGVALVAAVSAGAAACIGSDASPAPEPTPPPPPSDAAVVDVATAPDASTSPDAEAGGSCDRAALFTVVRKVDGLNSTAAEAYARFSANERVVYFQRTPLGGGVSVVLRAERPTRESAFGAAVPVQGLFSDARDPFVTEDELTIYYVGATGSQYDSYVAHRDAAAAPFGPYTPLPLSVPGSNSVEPFFRADGKELFFARGPVLMTNYNLWRAFALPDGGFFDVGPIDELNSSANDQSPAISDDGLDLYFYSGRNSASGGIWRAHRDSLGVLFRSPTLVSELTPDTGFVLPLHISSDQCRLYFSSDQDPSTGNDIYVAERSP